MRRKLQQLLSELQSQKIAEQMSILAVRLRSIIHDINGPLTVIPVSFS